MENKDIKTLELIRESIAIYGENKYDYTETIFINKNTKFKLKCKNNHLFEATYRSHIKEKYECRKCSIEIKAKNRLEKHGKEFIEKAIKVHNDLYDYSEVEYKGCLVNVKIKCKKGHSFDITPNMHLDGQGCKFCNEKLKKEGKPTLNVKIERKNKIWTTEYFIEEAKKVNGDNFDYSLVDVKNVNEKVIIICKKGHKFEQDIYHHLNGSNCKICESKKMCITTDEFIANSISIFGPNKFDYSETVYIDSYTKLKLICKEKNHKFYKTPNKHYSSLGCPFCVNKSEVLLGEYLKIINENIIHQYFFKNIEQIKKNPFDFCIEELKLIIELDGEQHFRYVAKFKKSVEERQKSDFIKMIHALNNGYTIIRIYQPDFIKRNIDWNNILKKNIKKYNTPSVIYLANNYSSYEIYENNFKLFKENNIEFIESLEIDEEDEENDEEYDEEYEEEEEEEIEEDENNSIDNFKFNEFVCTDFNKFEEQFIENNIIYENHDSDDNGEVYLSDYLVDDNIYYKNEYIKEFDSEDRIEKC